MKKLLFPAFLFLGLNCFSQYSGLVIKKGNFSPSATLTPAVERYQNYKYGWLINWTMNIYNGHFASCTFAPSPRAFNIINMDWETVADSMVANGVQYAVWTAYNEYGFKPFASNVKYNLTPLSFNGQTYPQYADYSVHGQADPNIMEKYFKAMRKRGLGAYLYVNPGWDLNMATPSLFDDTEDGRDRLHLDYFCRSLQEIALRYKGQGFAGFWVDYAYTFPAYYFQAIYNAVKSIDTNLLVIGNAIGETDMARGPYDVMSTEEYIVYNGNTAYQSTARTFNGQTVYVGQEGVFTPYSVNYQYYYYDELCPVQPPWTKMVTAPTADFQSIVTAFRNYHRPVLSSMMIDRYGKLVPATMNYLRQINFQ